MVFYPKPTLTIRGPQGAGGGGGGYPRFQVTGMIKWGKSQNTQKIVGLKLNPQKIPCRFPKP